MFSPRQLVGGILALAGAGLGATGCNSGCSAQTSGGQTPCANDHEILSCVEGGDVTGPYETRDACPVDRPVCQSDRCVSLTPVMCMEQLLGKGPTNATISSADLDGNGLDDVIFGGDGAGQWAVLAQTDGSFSAAQPIPSGLLVNVNGDGIPDLIDVTAKPATVALGDGHLGFGPTRTLPTSFNYLVGRGDFDGDGLEDFVDLVTNDDRSTDVAVHLAAADFATGGHLHLPADPFVSGGKVFPLQSNGQRWVLEIDHPASFETPVMPAMAELRIIGDLASPALATIPVAHLPADYDGDGNTDLIIDESVALGDGKGGFLQSTVADTGPFPAGPADFDGDGLLDFKQIDCHGARIQDHRLAWQRSWPVHRRDAVIRPASHSGVRPHSHRGPPGDRSGRGGARRSKRRRDPDPARGLSVNGAGEHAPEPRSTPDRSADVGAQTACPARPSVEVAGRRRVTILTRTTGGGGWLVPWWNYCQSNWMSAPLRVLVVYGVPARMKLTDAANKDIGKTFVLTKSNRESFEPALRNALTVFMGSDAVVPGARFVFIRGAGDFEAAVRSAEYTHVIYYGHALDGETALLPAKGSKIDADGLARALKGTTVTHFDILGCRSVEAPVSPHNCLRCFPA